MVFILAVVIFVVSSVAALTPTDDGSHVCNIRGIVASQEPPPNIVLWVTRENNLIVLPVYGPQYSQALSSVSNHGSVTVVLRVPQFITLSALSFLPVTSDVSRLWKSGYGAKLEGEMAVQDRHETWWPEPSSCGWVLGDDLLRRSSSSTTRSSSRSSVRETQALD